VRSHARHGSRRSEANSRDGHRASLDLLFESRGLHQLTRKLVDNSFLVNQCRSRAPPNGFGNPVRSKPLTETLPDRADMIRIQRRLHTFRLKHQICEQLGGEIRMVFHKIGAGQTRAETRLDADIPQQDVDLPRQIPWALGGPGTTECAFHVHAIGELGPELDDKRYASQRRYSDTPELHNAGAILQRNRTGGVRSVPGEIDCPSTVQRDGKGVAPRADFHHVPPTTRFGHREDLGDIDNGPSAIGRIGAGVEDVDLIGVRGGDPIAVRAADEDARIGVAADPKLGAQIEMEPARVCRRLQNLRDWSHEQARIFS